MSQAYFDRDLLNASTLKCYAGEDFSPRSAKLTPRTEKKAWDIGHAIHGGLEHMGQIPPNITVCPFDSYRSKDAKVWLAAEKDAGRIPLTSKEYEEVKEAIDRAWNNCGEEVKALLHHPEAKREEEMYTEEFKAMLDLRVGGVLLDYKSTRHALPKAILRDFFNMHYALQAYHYKMVAELKGIEVTDFIFLFVCTAAPFEINTFRVTEEVLEHGRDLWQRAYDRYAIFRDVADDGLPGYTTGIVDLLLPDYLTLDEDDVHTAYKD